MQTLKWWFTAAGLILFVLHDSTVTSGNSLKNASLFAIDVQ